MVGNQNIEIKAPLPNRDLTETRLRELGARVCWTRTQVDTFYDVPHGWLKIRETSESGSELISYVRPIDSAAPRVSDYDVLPIEPTATWKRLLERVLPVTAQVKKERTLWMYKNTRIHLDQVRKLGQFLELETLVGTRSPEEARRETDSILRALELDSTTFLAVPYLDLLSRKRSD
ncbi:MAG: class IV adenylate cyclase [Planctomycetota bacterium]|jgi:predicted adenylyl cyclase CyaB|nr:class IV adenylate cyclase [Planctomycetota bacterium]